MGTRWTRGALAVGVFLVALGFREAGPHTLPAAALGPRPDSVEYVAGAQAIVQDGRYFLQVGPQRVRPRYPPGQSLLLVPALVLGVPPDLLWRVTGLFGAGLAVLVGTLAVGAISRLRPGHDGAAHFAFAVAGGSWAVAPAAVDVGRAVLSDEPATFFLLLTVLLAIRAWRDPSTARGVRAGAAWAMLLAIRPVVAVPAALLLAPLAVASIRSCRGAQALFAAAGGIGGVALLVVGLLLRSGLPAWPWDGYAFWIPEREVAGGLWSVDYALHGDPRVPRESGGRTIGNLEFVTRSVLGLPGLPPHGTPGPVWPAVGLALVAVAAFRAPLRRALAVDIPGAWPALVLWLGFQIVFYGGYYFAASRFLLPVFALAAVAWGAGLGVLFARADRFGRTAAVLLAVAALLPSAWIAWNLESRSPRRLEIPSAVVVDAWLTATDAERAGRPVPFDPVHAQALGLLDPARLATIHEWGVLPETVHVRRLRAREAL